MALFRILLPHVSFCGVPSLIQRASTSFGAVDLLHLRGLDCANNTGHHATNQKCPSYDEPWNSGAGEVKIQTNDFVKECGGSWGEERKQSEPASKHRQGRGEVAGLSLTKEERACRCRCRDRKSVV